MMEMALARQDLEWATASTVVATLLNVNRGKKDRAIRPDDIHPMRSGSDNTQGIKLTAGNINVLKAFVPKHSPRPAPARAARSPKGKR